MRAAGYCFKASIVSMRPCLHMSSQDTQAPVTIVESMAGTEEPQHGLGANYGKQMQFIQGNIYVMLYPSYQRVAMRSGEEPRCSRECKTT